MIEMVSVSKVYKAGSRPAVSEVSLHVNQGEFVFLVGPSGAGKTTLIKLISREEMPTAGEIKFLGRETAAYKERQLLLHRRQMGLVFQDYRLLKSKTIYENVALALEVSGRPPQEIRRRVPAALARVGLAGKEGSFPDELSGGEQQRAGIARAIVREPLMILADEPTGNVDRETARGIMELFETINEGGTTVIIATHAWDMVDRLKKRVVSLEEGRIVGDEEQGSYGHVH
ncbi:MAG TPA: cell division ATP-binding protein FtsE [Firmicutes bacterium]|nr:cell division ATP-binding protein FtsE [Bacillota bacterium]